MCITVKQMMQIEENGHQMGFLRKFMMENAGAAAAKRLVEKFGDVKSKKVVVFAGPGNNGGDALVIARHLHGYGADVSMLYACHLCEQGGGHGSQHIKTEESRWNYDLITKMKIPELPKTYGYYFSSLSGQDLIKWDIVVDGLIGTGIRGDPYPWLYRSISYLNDIDGLKNAFKLAVDVPSGLNPDTGKTIQKTFDNGERTDCCVKADMTVTFHRMKVGMPKRTDVCGEIFVEKIGIPLEAEIGVL